MPKSKSRKPKGRKTEIVDVIFKKRKDGGESFTLGGLQGDTFGGIVSILCEANVRIKLEILPNLKEAKDKDFPGEDLRFWRGQIIGQVK